MSLGLLDASLAPARAAGPGGSPLAGRAPHFRPRARRVVHFFLNGGPSHVDTFDPKPALARHAGRVLPAGNLRTERKTGAAFPSPFAFRRRGQSGLEISDAFERTAAHADDIAVIRSMHAQVPNHEPSLMLMNCGDNVQVRPSFGAWTLYGLGTENANLPAYVVLADPGGLPVDGERNWSSGFLPAVYQGTAFRGGPSPVFHLKTPAQIVGAARSNQLALLDRLNRAHAAAHPDDTELAARISNFETAARMQATVPEVLDLSGESEATRRMYGLDNPVTAEYGRRCLLARRLVERGVRFVQLFLNGQPWDTHDKNAERLKGLCAASDQPSAALVRDLKARGLLDSTVVLWTGEFGRLPISQGTDGRDHNRHAFSLWMAGGGFRAGHVHGATDEFGYRSVQDVVSVHDFQATLLHALGIDHRLLHHPHEGRDASLTDAEVTGAKVVPALLA